MSIKKIAILDLKNPWIISDNECFLRDCTALGFKIKQIDQIVLLPEKSIIFSFCDRAARRAFELAKNTRVKQSLFCATHVFEPTIDYALYGLRLMLVSDFLAALQKQRHILARLENCHTLCLSAPDSTAEVVIAERSIPYAMVEDDISQSFIHSVAEFFEVHYAHMNPHTPCPFHIEGHLSVSGILTVLRKHTASPDTALKSALEHLTQAVAAHTGLLTIRDNTVASFTVKGIDYSALLMRAAGPRQLKLTEFAVGVNDAIAPVIDYRINSQMNEGINGVHVALGDGSSGYHIDFLSPGVSVSPALRADHTSSGE